MKNSFTGDSGQINPEKRSHSTAGTIYHIAPVEQPGGGFVYLFVKRAADFLLALLALLICFIPMLIIAICIRLDSPGPALYRQERLGIHGKPFTILKFRSMYLDAERNGAQWADENDPRITRVGKFLRKTRMDELPQFLNILAGQMSFVGPRPERQCFYEEFETNRSLLLDLKCILMTLGVVVDHKGAR